jgi:hypothetical protein
VLIFRVNTKKVFTNKKLIGFDVLTAVRSITFWDVMLYSPKEIQQHFKGKYCKTMLAASFLLVYCWSYSSAQKMKVVHSSRTMVNFTGLQTITPQTKVNFKKWSFKARVYMARKVQRAF